MSDRFDPRPVILQGLHARLEPLSLAHAPELYEAGMDEEIWAYMPVPPAKTVQDTETWIQQALDDCASGNTIPFAIVQMKGERAVGSTRYLDVQRENESLEIGFTWIGRAYQRTALNTECKLLLLGHAFEDLGAVRIQLKTDGRNVRSQRAIERLGAVHEGVLRRQRRVWDGHIRDTVYYSILDDEWPTVKTCLQNMLDR